MSKSELNQIFTEFRDFLINANDFIFEKKIGEGGFGEVFYGKHKQTGKECAIKRLFIDKLQKQRFVGFTREVAILATCDNFFLLPFYGFTESIPLLIVTQYIPNGSLFNALRHRKNAPDLNGTQKTIIALGIAYGMASLHSKGIIHRDLKSMNVLLDDELLPKICDFGVSRFASEEKVIMTKEIGTPHWMAPELFESNNYTNKVDVYAYGILLWEMLTEKVPFKGKEGYQIALAVCTKKERPAIPDHTPRPLKNLINICWDQDPNKRPKFQKIIKLLESKKVTFPKTDKDALDLLQANIREKEEKMKHRKHRNPLFNQSSQNIKLDGENNEYHRYSDSKDPFSASSSAALNAAAALLNESNNSDFNPTNEQEPDYSTITRTDDPNFKRNFKNCVRNLASSNADKFFTDIIPTFSSSMSTFVISQIDSIIRNNTKILNIFVNSESHVITKLPLNNADNINASLTLILYIVKNRPDVLSKDLLQYLSPLIPKESSKVLCIIYNAVKKFDELPNNMDICNFLINQSTYESFLKTPTDMEYLQLINFLISKYPSIRESRLNSFQDVILYALQNDQKMNAVHSAYSIFNSYFPPTSLLSEETIINHICGSQQLQDDVISYLLRRPSIPLPQSIISYIIKTAPHNKCSLALLLSATDRPGFIDTMLQLDDSWLVDGSLPLKLVSIVLLNSMSFKKKRKDISSMPHLSNFISMLISSNNNSTSSKTKKKNKKKGKKKESETENNESEKDKSKDKDEFLIDLVDVSMSITIVMSKNKKLMAKLNDLGYFTNLEKTVTQIGNSDIDKSAVVLIEKISKNSNFIPYVTCFIPFLANKISNASQLPPFVVQASLNALNSICKNENACELAKKSNIAEVIENVPKLPIYEIAITDIKKLMNNQTS